ncbi:hypothetical protein PINS_up000696 [Pythium insidiosum]|nr:hypothetical protein PINS_up000696 [Pythium insidiosum]
MSALSAATSTPTIATGFVRKLYRILDHESQDIIGWDRAGQSFSIRDVEQLDEVVLPRYFRGRLDAFRQQLNEHGFERLPTSVENRAAGHGVTETYKHKCFLRGCPAKLSHIIRVPLPRRRRSRKSRAKLPASKRGATTTTKAMEMLSLDTDVSMACSSPVANTATGATVPAGYNTDGADALAPLAALAPTTCSSNPLFTADEQMDIMQWLPVVPASDGVSPRGVDASLPPSSSTLHEPLSDSAIDAILDLLTASSGAAGTAAFAPSSLTVAPSTCQPPVVSLSRPSSPLWDACQFSEDTLSSMLDWLNSSPGVST